MPTARLATVALVIGSASLLWQVLGGLMLGHLLAGAARVTGRGRGTATLLWILAQVPGYAAIAGSVYSIVLGRRAAMGIEASDGRAGGFMRANAAITIGWLGVSFIVLSFVFAPVSNLFHNVTDTFRMIP